MSTSNIIFHETALGYGGGIHNASTGTLSIANSTISGNIAKGGNGNPSSAQSSQGGIGIGGGISNPNGTVNLANSSLTGNSVSDGDTIYPCVGPPNCGVTNTHIFTLASRGGGLSNGTGATPGIVNITNSTVSGNSASGGLISIDSTVIVTIFGGQGGGVDNDNGTVRVTNSTFFGNSAHGVTIGGSNGATNVRALPTLGGGIHNVSQLIVTNSTIAGNAAVGTPSFNGGPSSTGNGGGIDNNIGTGMFTAKNTIIATNTADVGPDFDGTLTSQGYNLIGNNKDATIIPAPGTADQIGTNAAPINPLLGPLANNGGPTFTMALLAGSPAIDKGAAAIDPISGLPITTDQRGLPRPNDDATIANALGGNGSDIGAFEVQCSFTCPPNQTAIAGANTCATVNYPPTTTSGSCGASVTCLPPSGTCFALGTTTVTCMEMDGSGGMAQCSFTVTVTAFDVCLQDDSDSRVVLLLNSTTGDYLFCGAGTPFSGRGQVTKKGSTLSFEHSPTDRRVTANVDGAVHRGKASLQSPAGTLRYTINDRDTTNNTCLCGAR